MKLNIRKMSDYSKQYLWRDLILFFERKHYVNNGLTIPFLIGAIKLLDGNKLKISQLLTEFSDIRNSKRTTIMKCGNIGEFVIGIMDLESEEYHNKLPNDLQKEFKKLAIIDNSLNQFNEIKELINFFENRYGFEIENEQYSKNLGKWTEFTKKDLENIESFKNEIHK